MTEARRSPDGYIAQHLYPDEPRGWILLRLNHNGVVTLTALTDDEVADWRPVVDEAT